MLIHADASEMLSLIPIHEIRATHAAVGGFEIRDTFATSVRHQFDA